LPEQPQEPESGQAPPPPTPPAVLPWEAPGAGVKAFFLTMYGIMARPSWALRAPPAGLWPRWAGFTLIMWFLVFVARYLLSWVWSMGAVGGVQMLAGGMMIMVVQAAIFLPLYSGAVLLTLNLLLKENSPATFSLVLRAVCYSQVSAAAMILPMVGIIVHLIWNVVLMAIGLRSSLGIGLRPALLGVLLPMVAFFLLGVILAGLGLGLQ